MLSIISVDTFPQNAVDFAKNEWAIADAIHFGRDIQWSKEKQALLAKDNDKIVGVLEMTMQAGVMYIDELIVDSTRQGQGIGTALMKRAEEIARNNKLHKIYLDTGENWPAVKFYESLGYQQTGVLPKHYVGIDYITFSKFL